MSFVRVVRGLLLLILLGGCAGVRQTMTPPPEITITTAAETDAIAVSYSHDAMAEAGWSAVLDVTSETGIGSGRATLSSGEWPSPLTLRLHLVGLEDLKVTAGNESVQLSVSSGSGREVRQTDGAGQELSPDDPFWLDVRFGDGYFDVSLPPALLAGSVEALDMSWIDFYR